MESAINSRVFYVHESVDAPIDCSIIQDNPDIQNVSNKISYISDSPTSEGNRKTLGPFSLLELESYIMTEMNDFVRALQMAGKCRANQTAECSQYFSDYTTNYPMYKSPIPAGTDSEKYVLKSRKQLCWRSFELLVLLLMFQIILEEFKQNKTVSDSESVNIGEMMRTNMALRKAVEQKVRDLKNGENALSTALKTTRERTDVTIYTSVLWTILATTVIFYWIKS